MIRRLWKVAFTEWKLMYTDAAAVLLLVVAGVLYAFYYPTPYIYQTVTKVPVAIVDMDNTAMSRDLIRMASASQQIEVKAVYSSMLQAEEAMTRDEIYGFMAIPENMEKDIRGHRQVTVNIFTHGAYVMFHGAIGTAFSTCALTLGATNNVPAAYLAGFTRVRTIEPTPTLGYANNLYSIPYTYAPAMQETGITNVGYYIELVRKDTGALQAMWIDMNAPGSNWADVSLPVTLAQQKQQTVTKLHVWSNFGGVRQVPANDDTVEGFIEFTPQNYSEPDVAVE